MTKPWGHLLENEERWRSDQSIEREKERDGGLGMSWEKEVDLHLHIDGWGLFGRPRPQVTLLTSATSSTPAMEWTCACNSSSFWSYCPWHRESTVLSFQLAACIRDKYWSIKLRVMSNCTRTRALQRARRVLMLINNLHSAITWALACMRIRSAYMWSAYACAHVFTHQQAGGTVAEQFRRHWSITIYTNKTESQPSPPSATVWKRTISKWWGYHVLIYSLLYSCCQCAPQ